MDINNDKLIYREISDEMRTSFLDYAMSVIVARALPDVRDGLKPVHRLSLIHIYCLNLKQKKLASTFPPSFKQR